jgi:hypothetical protein
LDVGRVDTTFVAKAMEKVVIKKDVKKNLKLPNIVGLVKVEEVDCRNPTLAKCEGEARHLEKVRIWSPLGLPNV